MKNYLLLSLCLCAVIIPVEAQFAASDNNLSALFEDSGYTFNDLSVTWNEPQGVVADFNGDGVDDLFVCGVRSLNNSNVYFAHLYLGNKSGLPIRVVLSDDFDLGGANPVMDYLPNGANKWLLTIQGTTKKNPVPPNADWWKTDSPALQSAVYELTHTGNNKFTLSKKQTLSQGAARGSLLLLDVNDDTHPDIVQYGFNAFESGGWATKMNVYLNNGQDQWVVSPKAIGLLNRAELANGFMHKADFDRDGRQDLVLFNNNNVRGNNYVLGDTPSLYVFFNKGDGGFEMLTLPSMLQSDWERREQISLTVGDFNNDGYPDIYAFAQNPKSGYDWWMYPVEVWINDRKKNFDPSPQVLTGVNRSVIGVGDFNGDGNLDLVYSAWGTQDHQEAPQGGGNGDRLFLQSGYGDGTFRECVVNAGNQPNAVMSVMVNGSYFAGDFNGDGVDDIMQLGVNYRKLYYSKAWVLSKEMIVPDVCRSWSDSGLLYVDLTGPKFVAVYDRTGQLLLARWLPDGLTQLPVSTRGPVLIKAGEETKKVYIH